MDSRGRLSPHNPETRMPCPAREVRDIHSIETVLNFPAFLLFAR